MKNIHFTILIILITLFISCTKEIKIKEGNISALAINAIINPDSIIKVNISKVNSFNNSSSSFINNANIRLFEDDILLSDPINISEGWYEFSIYPKALSNYKIEIKAHGMQANSHINIPQKNKILKAEYAIFPFISSAGEEFYIKKSTIKFIDNKDTEDYYEIFLSHNGIFQTNIHFNSLDIGDIIEDPILLNEGDENFYPTTYFFSDKLFNGDTCQLIIPEGGTASYYNSEFQEDDGETNIHLRKISKSYYLYRKYLTRHIYNQQNGNDYGDPVQFIFQGEPLEMYSNIQNAYGVFIAYHQDIKKLKYKKNK